MVTTQIPVLTYNVSTRIKAGHRRLKGAQNRNRSPVPFHILNKSIQIASVDLEVIPKDCTVVVNTDRIGHWTATTTEQRKLSLLFNKTIREFPCVSARIKRTNYCASIVDTHCLSTNSSKVSLACQIRSVDRGDVSISIDEAVRPICAYECSDDLPPVIDATDPG